MFPFPFWTIIFVTIRTTDGIKNNMAVDMVCIIMDRINCLKIRPQVFFYKLPYNLKGRLFRDILLFKRNDKVISLPFIQLSKVTLRFQHLRQRIFRNTVAAADIPAALCFIRVHDIFQPVCKMLRHIPGFCLLHMQDFCDRHRFFLLLLQFVDYLLHLVFQPLHKHIQPVFILFGIQPAVIVMGNLVDVYPYMIDLVIQPLQFLPDCRVIPGTVSDQHPQELGIRYPHFSSLFLQFFQFRTGQTDLFPAFHRFLFRRTTPFPNYRLTACTSGWLFPAAFLSIWSISF